MEIILIIALIISGLFLVRQDIKKRELLDFGVREALADVDPDRRIALLGCAQDTYHWNSATYNQACAIARRMNKEGI